MAQVAQRRRPHLRLVGAGKKRARKQAPAFPSITHSEVQVLADEIETKFWVSRSASLAMDCVQEVPLIQFLSPKTPRATGARFSIIGHQDFGEYIEPDPRQTLRGLALWNGCECVPAPSGIVNTRCSRRHREGKALLLNMPLSEFNRLCERVESQQEKGTLLSLHYIYLKRLLACSYVQALGVAECLRRERPFLLLPGLPADYKYYLTEEDGQELAEDKNPDVHEEQTSAPFTARHCKRCSQPDRPVSKTLGLCDFCANTFYQKRKAIRHLTVEAFMRLFPALKVGRCPRCEMDKRVLGDSGMCRRCAEGETCARCTNLAALDEQGFCRNCRKLWKRKRAVDPNLTAEVFALTFCRRT